MSFGGLCYGGGLEDGGKEKENTHTNTHGKHTKNARRNDVFLSGYWVYVMTYDTTTPPLLLLLHMVATFACCPLSLCLSALL